jgi:hypothetical protein
MSASSFRLKAMVFSVQRWLAMCSKAGLYERNVFPQGGTGE